MAVLKNLRSLSNMQFYKTAIYIRKELTDWMLRDFGTTKNKKSVFGALFGEQIYAER